MRLSRGIAAAVCTILVLTSLFWTRCSVTSQHSLQSIRIPEGFPAIVFPEDNAFSPARWRLGKALFYDKALSLDSSISCASCHQPALAFSDSLAFSTGVKKLSGTQNAPTLANVAYHPYYTRLGGVSTLEKQVLVPIQEHNEFNFNIIEIAKRLGADSVYQRMSRKAYNRGMDYYVITRALANFERSLISGQSRYDAYTLGKIKLTEAEIRGMQLFFSERTNCAKCHSGFNFTSYAFENNGLYEVYKDQGRKRLTEKEEDLEKFKVPTLRNVALTAPYMHDGSLLSLEQVIGHYNSGGRSNPRKSGLVRPLHLTDAEQKDLVAFLRTLNDSRFISNPAFASEQKRP